uniref:O-methyltransferase-like protein n=1 Tax=Adineta vaga TaxID=104782 RepID=B3G468_ADIVA|nr:unknown [Adineta vaga]
MNLLSYKIPVWMCVAGVVFYIIFNMNTSRTTVPCLSPKRSSESFFIPMKRPLLKQHKGCLPYDPHMKAKDLFQEYFQILKNPQWIARRPIYSISFNQLHSLLYGSNTKNIYKSWPNYHKKHFNRSYPYTSMTRLVFKSIAQELSIPLHLVVEIGSFIGKSSSNIGRVIQNNPAWADKTVLLCIDTWLGSVEHWIQERPLIGIEFGRPTIYEQFLANMIEAELTNTVLPLSTPSLVGAQILLRHKLFPQIIFLDSAHLQGETLVELELYWELLQPGGILVGDDWKWIAVQCDLLRFADSVGVKPNVIKNIWYIKKEIDRDYD